jgi:hypothetical protein
MRGRSRVSDLLSSCTPTARRGARYVHPAGSGTGTAGGRRRSRRCMQAEEELTVKTLIGVAEGCWVVTTASASVYEVDLDNSTLTRRPSDRAQGKSPLRRDGDPLRILGIVALTVGRPAIFHVDLEHSGVASTRRVTTTVVSIDSVGPGVGSASLIAEFADLVKAWDCLDGRDIDR